MVAAAKPHAVSISAPTSPAWRNPEYCPNSLRQTNCSSALPSDAAVTSSPSHSLKADVFEIARNFASAVSGSIMTAPLPLGDRTDDGSREFSPFMHIDAYALLCI